MNMAKCSLTISKNCRYARLNLFQKNKFFSLVHSRINELNNSKNHKNKNSVDFPKKFSLPNANFFFQEVQPKLLAIQRQYSTNPEPELESKRVHSISTKLRRLRELPSYYLRQCRANEKPESPKCTRRSVQSYKFNMPPTEITSKTCSKPEKSKLVCLSCGKPKKPSGFTKSFTSTLAEDGKLPRICQKCGKEQLHLDVMKCITCSGCPKEKSPEQNVGTKVCKECGQKITPPPVSKAPPKPIVQLSQPFKYEDIPKCATGAEGSKSRCQPTPPKKPICQASPPNQSTKPKDTDICKSKAESSSKSESSKKDPCASQETTQSKTEATKKPSIKITLTLPKQTEAVKNKSNNDTTKTKKTESGNTNPIKPIKQTSGSCFPKKSEPKPHPVDCFKPDPPKTEVKKTGEDECKADTQTNPCFTKTPKKEQTELDSKKEENSCGAAKPKQCVPIDFSCEKNKESKDQKESKKASVSCFPKPAKKETKSNCDVTSSTGQNGLCAKHAAEAKAAQSRLDECTKANLENLTKNLKTCQECLKTAGITQASDAIDVKFVPKCKPDEILERGLCIKTNYKRCSPSPKNEQKSDQCESKPPKKEGGKCPFECPNSKCPFMEKLPKELLECICKECNTPSEQKEALQKLECICKNCILKKIKKKKSCCDESKNSKTCDLENSGKVISNDMIEYREWDIPTPEEVAKMLDDDFNDIIQENDITRVNTIKTKVSDGTEVIGELAQDKPCIHKQNLKKIIPAEKCSKREYSGTAKPRKCCCHTKKPQDEAKYQWKKENQPMKPTCTSSKLRCSCSLDDVEHKKTNFEAIPCSCGWKRVDDGVNKGCLRCGQVKKYHTLRPAVSQMSLPAWLAPKRSFQTVQLSSILATSPPDFFPDLQSQTSSECEKKACKLKSPEKKLRSQDKKNTQQLERCDCGKKRNHVGPCIPINKCTLTDCLCGDCDAEGITVVIKIPDEAMKVGVTEAANQITK